MAGDDTETGRTEPLVDGLTNPRTLSLDRFLIRLRSSSATQSAWRLSVDSSEGQGTIIFVEISPVESFFRGDGVFLGWSQERLGGAYEALRPRPTEPDFEMHQLG